MLSLSPLSEKQCSKCKALKITAEFWKSSNNTDGFRGKCIPCEMQYRHERRHIDRETSNNSQRRRREAERVKALEAQRQWAEANPEKVIEAEEKRLKVKIQKKREQARKWREENPEKVRESQRKYRESHPEIYREATKKYYQANPEVKRAGERKRKAKKHDNPAFDISTKELKKLYARPCSYCGSFEEITLDHVVPISKGGTHGVSNLVPACGPCNSSKGQKLLIEWKLYKNRKGSNGQE
jgi:5-methylcytosine-specific restriction endonuclease McrA